MASKRSLARKIYLELIRLYPETEQLREDEKTGIKFLPYSYRLFKSSPIGKAVAEVEAEEKRYNRDR